MVRELTNKLHDKLYSASNKALSEGKNSKAYALAFLEGGVDGVLDGIGIYCVTRVGVGIVKKIIKK